MITSTSNRLVKWVRALQIKRRERSRDHVFVIEGDRLAQEAVRSGAKARVVMHKAQISARTRGLVNSLARLGAETIEVSDAVLRHCSAHETPPGILAVLAQPTLDAPQPLTLALVIDRLADPGNLGTLLRSALASGVEAVFLTQGTVDAYNPKVVRGAMGAHFHLPIAALKIGQLQAQLAGMHLWVAEARSGERYDRVDWTAPSALAVGNEAHGVDPALSAAAEGAVHIPLQGEVESLNAAVAASVILFEIARQRGER